MRRIPNARVWTVGDSGDIRVCDVSGRAGEMTTGGGNRYRVTQQHLLPAASYARRVMTVAIFCSSFVNVS